MTSDNEIRAKALELAILNEKNIAYARANKLPVEENYNIDDKVKCFELFIRTGKYR